MKTTHSITSLPAAPADDRRARMIKYSITMGIRIVCIVGMLFVQGWWLLVLGLGAIVLPYFAMIWANVSDTPTAEVERPTHIVKVDKGDGTAA